MMIGGEKEVVERLDPIFAALAPGLGNLPRTAGSRRPRCPRRARLHPCRAERRRPFREDGAQRHRIRPHAGLCGGLRHPEERRQRSPSRRTSASISMSPILPRFGGVAASSAPGCSILPRPRSRRIRSLQRIRALSRIPAKAVGPSWRRSRRPSRPTCFLLRSMPASAPASEHTFAEKVLSAMRKGFGGHVEPEARHP